MTHGASRHQLTALREVESDLTRSTTCPLCHTASPSMPVEDVKPGGDWQCARCGHRWDATRLATVASYTAWALDHDSAANGPAARRQRVPLPVGTQPVAIDAESSAGRR